MRPAKSQLGFTLVMLLLSIAIIAIMVTLALTKSNSDQKETLSETQDQAEQDLKTIDTNLENYQQEIDIQNEINSIQ